MNHQEKVRRFFEIIAPERKGLRPSYADRWLWSLGYKTPPSVVWPLWAYMFDVIWICLILRPIIFIFLVFFTPKDPQAPFLIGYWDALTDPRDAITYFVFAIVCVYVSYTWCVPWKRWRQLWKELDPSESERQLPHSR
jgi:hypothetical protein